MMGSIWVSHGLTWVYIGDRDNHNQEKRMANL